MKRTVVSMLLLLAVVSVAAQERKGPQPGMVYGLGLNGKYQGLSAVVEFAPEVSVGYRWDGKNAVGFTWQADCVYGLAQHLFLTHTHDFTPGWKTAFVQYEAGLSEVGRTNGLHLGFEGGYRFPVSGKAALRLLLSVDVNQVTVLSARQLEAVFGIGLRMEL